MTLYEDDREYRTTKDTHWSTKVALETDEGEAGLSFSVKNGQVRVVKDGDTLFVRRNSDGEYRNFTFSDYSDGATYEFQIAGYGDEECRVENIAVEVASNEELEE